jgi:hypothetical protein
MKLHLVITLLLLPLLALADTTVSYQWLVKDFIPAHRKYIRETRITYKLGTFDCRHFSRLFHDRLLATQDLKQGQDRPIRYLIVEQKKPFGGVPASKVPHKLVKVLTDKGWVVVEPQTGRTVLFDKYPNRNNITKTHL